MMLNEDLVIEKEKENKENYKFDLSFKIILLGDISVGKTSLILNATKNIFDGKYEPTIHFEFYFYFLTIEGKRIKLEIWDTCGQETYRALIISFYRSSSFAIMVYSIDCRQSFKNMNEWLNEIKTKSNPDIKIALIGNKCDLEDKRQVQKEEGEKFSNDNDLSFFMETSAKTGFNSKNIFNEIGKILFKEYNRIMNRNPTPFSSDKSLTTYLDLLSEEENKQKKKKCFC